MGEDTVTLMPRGLSWRRQEIIFGYIFILPWLLGFLLFTAGPLLASLGLSLTDWSLIETPRWIGLDNYIYMFTNDKPFVDAARVTGTFTGIYVPLNIMLAMAIAMLMNQKVPGISFFRTVYYLPAVVSGVAVAIVWMWVFQEHFGILNSFLKVLGIKGPGWLTNEYTALPAFLIMSLWGVGGSMVIYLSGLQSIPTELYEAAMIDGANVIQKFRNVTIPMMTPVIFFSLIMSVISSFQAHFTTAFVMTQGGPARATYFYSLHIYKSAFEYYRMGYAAALAWVLFLIVLCLTLLLFSSSSHWVHYAGVREDRKI